MNFECLSNNDDFWKKNFNFTILSLLHKRGFDSCSSFLFQAERRQRQSEATFKFFIVVNKLYTICRTTNLPKKLALKNHNLLELFTTILNMKNLKVTSRRLRRRSARIRKLAQESKPFLCGKLKIAKSKFLTQKLPKLIKLMEN